MPESFPSSSTASIGRSDTGHHVREHEAACLICALLIVVFGVVHEAVHPDAWDPWIIRGIFAALGLGLYAGHRMSACVRARFSGLLQTLLYLFMLWAAVLCAVNSFPPDYALGLTFAIVGTLAVFNMVFRRGRSLLIYLIYCVALTGVALVATPESQVNRFILFTCLAGSATAVYYVGARSIRTGRELANSEERLHAADDLAEMREFFEDALNKLPLEVAILDKEGRYQYVNPAAVGDPDVRAWMVGKTTVDYGRERGVDIAPFKERYEWLLEVVRSGEEQRHEESFRSRSGEVRHVLRVASPVLDKEGSVAQIFAYGLDLTDRKRHEHELQEAKEKAEEMLQLKTAFLNNMSHELRTPLTGILGFANALADHAEGDALEFARIISRSAERLYETLNSVLELSRLESSRYELRPHEIDLVTEVNDAASLLRLPATKKGLALSVVHHNPDALAVVDAACFGRILNNLVGNAIKFTQKGGVTVETRCDDTFFELRVSDTGIGIHDSFLPHLFEAFRQESTGLGRAHEGVGLGLSITKRLVDMLDGTITVESKVNYGTTFTVRLPRAAQAAPGGDGAVGRRPSEIVRMN